MHKTNGTNGNTDEGVVLPISPEAILEEENANKPEEEDKEVEWLAHKYVKHKNVKHRTVFIPEGFEFVKAEPDEMQPNMVKVIFKKKGR